MNSPSPSYYDDFRLGEIKHFPIWVATGKKIVTTTKQKQKTDLPSFWTVHLPAGLFLEPAPGLAVPQYPQKLVLSGLEYPQAWFLHHQNCAAGQR